MTEVQLDYMPTWEGVGLCVDQPDVLYPGTPIELAHARALCHSCPVIDQCRTWVLSIPSHLGPDGVVAAMTDRERERILLGQQQKQCITCMESKPLYKFARNSEGKEGRRLSCTACTSKPASTKIDAATGEELKTCPRCRTVRGRSRFSPNRDNPDGLAVWCKPCFNDLKGSQ
jgi:hypothetical protein